MANDLCIVCDNPIPEAFRIIARSHRSVASKNDPVVTCSSGCTRLQYARAYAAEQRKKKRSEPK